MIKEALKKIGKKLALTLCVSAMCIGGAAVSAQAAETAEVQESESGSAEIAAVSVDEYLDFGKVVGKKLTGWNSYKYEISLSKSGRVRLDFESYGTKFKVYWYDEYGKEMFKWYMDYNSTLGYAKGCGFADLLSGTYYVEVVNDSYSDTGNYKLKATFASAGTNEKEPNNNSGNAMPIKMNSVIKGQLARNDDQDFFKFRVTRSGDVTIKITSKQLRVFDFNIYDQNGSTVVDDTVYSNDAGNIDTKLTYKLDAGLYYMGIVKKSYESYNTGAYAFKVTSPIALGSKNVTLSKSKYEYDGKVKSPAVIVKDNSGKRLVKGRDYDVYAQKGRRNVGVYKCKVVFKGSYKGSVTKTITIVPARTKITGIANKSNGIKIAWKQRSAANATGYIVYRSVNGGAYKQIKVIRSTRTTVFTDTGAWNKWDSYSYKVIVYKNLRGKTYKSPASNSKSVYRY